MNQKDLFRSYLLKFALLPYIYGSSSPLLGLDCSQLVQEALAMFGLDPKGDQTADDLYKHFMFYGKKQNPIDLGHLLFFGRPERISHIAIALDHELMIEAGGGDQTTKTFDQAIKANAYVRIRRIDNRKDLVDVLKPKGLPW